MKKSTLRLFVLLLVIALCVGLFAACNSNTKKTDTNKTQDGEQGGNQEGGGDSALPTYAGSNLGGLLYSRTAIGNANISTAGFLDAFAKATGGATASGEAASAANDGLVIEGETYDWTDFSDYSNLGDYFTAIVNNVKNWVSGANTAIAHAVQTITTVNTWVGDEYDKYLLNYDAAEKATLLYHSFKIGEDDLSLRLYKVYFDETGAPAYEIYAYDTSEQPSLESLGYFYSCDGVYEISHRVEDSNGLSESVAIAETKNGRKLTEIQSRYSKIENEDVLERAVVLQLDEYNDYKFDKSWTIYNPVVHPTADEIGKSSLSVMNKNMTHDVMSVNFDGAGGESKLVLELFLNGFTGVEALRETSSDEELASGTTVSRNGTAPDYTYSIGTDYSPDVVLTKKTDGTNNDVIVVGDTFAENTLTYTRGNVLPITEIDYETETAFTRYYPSITLEYAGDNIQAACFALASFFEETGIECKSDFEKVTQATAVQYEMKDELSKIFQCRDYVLSNWENTAAMINAEKAARDVFAAALKAKNDTGTVTPATAQPTLDAKIAQLPDFSEYVKGGITFEDGKIDASGLSIEIPDNIAANLVFEDGEKYAILLALKEVPKASGSAAGPTPTYEEMDGELSNIMITYRNLDLTLADKSAEVYNSKTTTYTSTTIATGFAGINLTGAGKFKYPGNIAEGDYALTAAVVKYTAAQDDNDITEEYTPISMYAPLSCPKDTPTIPITTLTGDPLFDTMITPTNEDTIEVTQEPKEDAYQPNLDTFYMTPSSEDSDYSISALSLFTRLWVEYEILSTKIFLRLTPDGEWTDYFQGGYKVEYGNNVIPFGEYKLIGILCKDEWASDIQDSFFKDNDLEYYLTIAPTPET